MMTKQGLAFISKMVCISIGFSIFSYSHAHATELAKINGTTIVLEDFEKKYKDNLRFFPLNAPTKKGVLDDLVKRELAIQKAKAEGLEKDPEIRDRIDTLLYQALLERKLSKEFEKIFITDEAAKAFYSKNPIIRTSHIFVALQPNAPANEEKQAYNKIKKIYDEQHIGDGKAVFSDIAQKFSEGPYAPMGGDRDYQTRDRLDPLYYEAALKLKEPGKISGIVRDHSGYHIIKLTAVKAWEDVDPLQVKKWAIEAERGKIFEKYMTQLRAQGKVTVHSELLKEKPEIK
jgi:parvulin-like peptidyl-prolyl isomerase